VLHAVSEKTKFFQRLSSIAKNYMQCGCNAMGRHRAGAQMWGGSPQVWWVFSYRQS
jgi:hypothetical protein